MNQTRPKKINMYKIVQNIYQMNPKYIVNCKPHHNHN